MNLPRLVICLVCFLATNFFSPAKSLNPQCLISSCLSHTLEQGEYSEASKSLPMNLSITLSEDEFNAFKNKTLRIVINTTAHHTLSVINRVIKTTDDQNMNFDFYIPDEDFENDIVVLVYDQNNLIVSHSRTILDSSSLPEIDLTAIDYTQSSYAKLANAVSELLVSNFNFTFVESDTIQSQITKNPYGQYIVRLPIVSSGNNGGSSGGNGDDSAPAAITDLTAVAGDTKVTLTWTIPSGVVDNFTIEQKLSSDTTWSVAKTLAGTVNTTEITGLTNDTSYDFKMKASNSHGDSPDSNIVTVTPKAAGNLPGKVASLSSDSQTVDSISLLWAEPDNGGSQITDYKVEFKLHADSTWSSFADGVSTSLSAVVNGLTAGTAYDFRVAAQNALGLGEYSDTLTQSTLTDDAAPGLVYVLPFYGQSRSIGALGGGDSDTVIHASDHDDIDLNLLTFNSGYRPLYNQDPININSAFNGLGLESLRTGYEEDVTVSGGEYSETGCFTMSKTVFDQVDVDKVFAFTAGRAAAAWGFGEGGSGGIGGELRPGSMHFSNWVIGVQKAYQLLKAEYPNKTVVVPAIPWFQGTAETFFAEDETLQETRERIRSNMIYLWTIGNRYIRRITGQDFDVPVVLVGYAASGFTNVGQEPDTKGDPVRRVSEAYTYAAATLPFVRYANPEWAVKRSNYNDGVHLKSAGYARLGELLGAEVSNYVNDLGRANGRPIIAENITVSGNDIVIDYKNVDDLVVDTSLYDTEDLGYEVQDAAGNFLDITNVAVSGKRVTITLAVPASNAKSLRFALQAYIIQTGPRGGNIRSAELNSGEYSWLAPQWIEDIGSYNYPEENYTSPEATDYSHQLTDLQQEIIDEPSFISWFKGDLDLYDSTNDVWRDFGKSNLDWHDFRGSLSTTTLGSRSAVIFDGSTNYIDGPEAAPLGDYTVYFKGRIPHRNLIKVILGSRNNEGKGLHRAIYPLLTHGSRANSIIESSYFSSAGYPGSYTADEEILITVFRDLHSKTVKFRINDSEELATGVLESSTGNIFPAFETLLRIGANKKADWKFEGLMSDLIIFNRNLQDTEIDTKVLQEFGY